MKCKKQLIKDLESIRDEKEVEFRRAQKHLDDYLEHNYREHVTDMSIIGMKPIKQMKCTRCHYGSSYIDG